ncbi:MAG TPA: hypothetical protein VF024_19270 [Solirubrobacteraceae bacterium]
MTDRVLPTPAEGVHVEVDADAERVVPAEVVRERILHGDPPTIDPPDTAPDPPARP